MDIPKYKTIVVDPPWSYGDEHRPKLEGKWKSGDLIKVSVTDAYNRTMTVEEIKEFKLVRELADQDNCLCFLWTTNRYVFECPAILDSWGFNIGTGGRLMGWNKYGSCAQVPGAWKSNLEYVVVGSLGNSHNKWKSTSGLKACFSAMNEGHSIKPALFYRMLEKCTHEPRIDVFARRRHLGFDAWGDQVEVRESDLVSNYPPQKVIQLGTGELHMDLKEDVVDPQDVLL